MTKQYQDALKMAAEELSMERNHTVTIEKLKQEMLTNFRLAQRVAEIRRSLEYYPLFKC